MAEENGLTQETKDRILENIRKALDFEEVTVDVTANIKELRSPPGHAFRHYWDDGSRTITITSSNPSKFKGLEEKAYDKMSKEVESEQNKASGAVVREEAPTGKP